MNNIITFLIAVIIGVSGIAVQQNTNQQYNSDTDVTEITEATDAAEATDYYGYTKSDYLKMEADAKDICLQTFQDQKTVLNEVVKIVDELLIDNKGVSIIKRGSKYSICDGQYNDIGSSLNAEQDQLLYNFLFECKSKSVGIWGEGNIVCITLYQNCFYAGLVWSKDTLPKYYEYYPELLELGDGWFYYRTDYFE